MKKLWFVLFLSFLSPLAAAGGNVLPAPENPVPGEYMVVLREGAARRPAAAESAGPSVEQISAELAHRYGGEVLSVWKHALQGFAIRMAEPAARALAADPRVRWVEQDSRTDLSAAATVECSLGTPPTRDIPFPAISPQTIDCTDPVNDCLDNWGLDRIDQAGRIPTDQSHGDYRFDLTGAGVHVYVIDSGITLDHEEFRDRLGNSRILNGINKSGVGAENDLSDVLSHGHGTHVAGIIAGKTFGVAKEAWIHPVKVTATAEKAPRRIIDGIEWIAEHRILPAVANLSGGNGEASWKDDSTLRLAALGLIESGVALVQAAGNQDIDVCERHRQQKGASMGHLYGAPEVIIVGGTNIQDQRYLTPGTCRSSGECGSNYGRCVDLWAPAQNILSASKSELTAPGTTDPWFDSYCRLTGTSMAAPHATGVAALLLQRYDHANDRLSPGAVQTALLAAAVGGKLPTALPEGIGSRSPNLLLQSRFPLTGPPAAGDDYFRKSNNSPLSITYDQLLANDFDWEERALSVVGVQSPGNGTLTLNANGFTYNPNGYTGSESFTYRVLSSSGLETLGTIFILDTRPVAVDNHVAQEQGFDVLINMLDNDFDPDGFPGFQMDDEPEPSVFLVGIARNPSHGSLDCTDPAQCVYKPELGFTGSDSFEYLIRDDELMEARGTVYITVFPDFPTLAPRPEGDLAQTEGGTPVTIDVKQNDMEPDSAPLTLGIVTSPGHGSATIDRSLNPEQIVYTPAANFAGFDSFTYTVKDPQGNVGAASVSVEVFPVTPGPVARDDFFTAQRDMELPVGYTGLLSNDSGAGLGIPPTQITEPQHGSLRICCSAEGFTYTPDPGFTGRDWLRYTVVDANNRTATATIWIDVQFVNHPPDAVPDTVTVEHDTAKTIPVLANDTDPDYETLTIVSVTQPFVGGSVSTDGTTVTFTPTPGYSGDSPFTYTIEDPHHVPDTAAVTVRVRAQNQPPDAVDDSFPSFRNQPFPFSCASLLANDTDPDQDVTLGDRLIVTSIGPLPAGSGALSCVNCNCIYTPAQGLIGQVAIPYAISDERPGGSDAAFARINITNRSPVAVTDAAGTSPGTARTIPVLANDGDPDGDPVTVHSITAQPAAGAGTCAVAAGNTAVTYTPPAGFLGTATCSYKITDGIATSAAATITMYINRPPIARGDQVRIPYGLQTQIGRATLLANDYDPDGNTLTIASFDTTGMAGTLSCPAGSSFCTYTPPPGFTAVTRFNYTATDGRTGFSTATVKLKVGIVQSLPVANDDLFTTTLNTPKAFTLLEVLANDTDADGDVLNAVINSGPRDYGTMSCSTPAYNCTYTPNPGFIGIDRFFYSATDGADGSSTAFLKMVVLPPAAPAFDAQEDQLATAQNTSRFFTLGFLKVNDYSPTGDPLTITGFNTTGLIGTLDCASDPNGCLYRPPSNFSGFTSFRYTVSDAHGQSDTAIVRIKVAMNNAAPVAVNDSLAARANTPLRFSVFDLLKNDMDAENDPTTVVVYPYASHGTVSCSSPTYWCTYTPAANYTGPDAFSYIVSDGLAYSTQATVAVTVQPQLPKDAQILSQSVPAGMLAGQSYPVSITLKNVGTQAWGLVGPQCNAFRLGSVNPYDNTTWGASRVELPGPVAAGGEVTLSFTVTAPATPGTYNFQRRMVHECVEWFGDLTPNVAVKVN